MFAIVAALKAEIIPLFNHFKITAKLKIGTGTLYQSEHLHLLRIGVGGQNAVSNLKRYFEKFNPDAILNIGFAGNMNRSEIHGTVFSVRRVFHISEKVGLNLKSFTQKDLSTASVLTVDAPLKDAHLRDDLFKQFQTDLVDMEAWYLAECASDRNIPFFSIKVVSDQADENVDDKFIATYKKQSRVLTEAVLPLIQHRINFR